jgi:hypothetical protein
MCAICHSSSMLTSIQSPQSANMPKKTTQTKQTKATAKTKAKEPESKFTYDLSRSDLPHYTGTLSFDGSNDERAEAIKKHFPNYDCTDPRTFVAIPYATIRASLGGDYTGQEKFPPYMAYPANVAKSFSKQVLTTMGLGNPGTLHRLYPLNFDQRGRLRENVGMTKAELTQFLARFADATKKQPKQAKKKTREQNLKAWLMMERDEEKREAELEKAEREMLAAEAFDLDNAHRQQTPDTDDAADTSDESGDARISSTIVGSQRANSNKRSADEDAGSEADVRSTKKAKISPSLDKD